MIVPIPTDIDPTGEAQEFAGLASRAIMFGNTRQAREYHDKAGQVYEHQVLNLRKRSEKDALRYLAATQYYHGGLYDKALKLCRRIQADKLPNRFHGNYAEFQRAVHERAKPDYAQKIREELERHWQKQEYQQVLDLLKEHQYVIENESRLAAMRGQCCERLGDYKTAAIFFSDAVQKAPNDPQGMSFVAESLIGVLFRVQITDAVEYAQQLLAKLPHALTTLAAAVVRFHQAVPTQDYSEKQNLYDEHLRLFRQGEELFFQLPTAIQQRVDYRELMILSFVYAVGAYCYLGNLSRAQDVINQAIAFAPDDHMLQALQTMLSSPSPDAEKVYQLVIGFSKEQASERAAHELAFGQAA